MYAVSGILIALSQIEPRLITHGRYLRCLCKVSYGRLVLLVFKLITAALDIGSGRPGGDILINI